MPGRPYLRWNIDELERLFESKKDDRKILEDLREELTHRNKGRAKVLLARVEASLSAHGMIEPVVDGRIPPSNVIELPPYIFGRSLASAVAVCEQIVGSEYDEVICDASQVVFVGPVGLCLLAATCHKLARSGRRMRLANVPAALDGYLARMDLFKACGIEYEETFTRHDRRASLIEVCVADRSAEVDSLANRIANALVGVTPVFDPHAKPDEMTGYLPHDYLFKPLHHIFSELLENGVTHGKKAGHGEARTWVAAQYYPSRDRISLAVVDDGCGFLSSLTRHPRLVEKNHEAAIRLACEPRVTCNPDLDIHPEETANQGVGLTVVREVALRGGGIIRIASGDTLVEQTAQRDRTRRIPGWKGVVLDLEFERDLLQQVSLGQIIHELRRPGGGRGPRFG